MRKHQAAMNRQARAMGAVPGARPMAGPRPAVAPRERLAASATAAQLQNYGRGLRQHGGVSYSALEGEPGGNSLGPPGPRLRPPTRAVGRTGMAGGKPALVKLARMAVDPDAQRMAKVRAVAGGNSVVLEASCGWLLWRRQWQWGGLLRGGIWRSCCASQAESRHTLRTSVESSVKFDLSTFSSSQVYMRRNEEELRDTYHIKAPVAQLPVAAWGGLAGGANPEGTDYGVGGKPALRPCWPGALTYHSVQVGG